MSLARKLNLKDGMKMRVIAKPAPVIAAAKADRLAWVAYPKAGQLGTDVNRDTLAPHLHQQGVQGVRMIAIDSVWSAIRFRPQV